VAENKCSCEAKAGIAMKGRDEFWVEMALPSEEMAHVIYQWRSDPATRAASLHTSLPEFEAFYKDFQAHYFSYNGLLPFFVRDGQERVAFVRFRPYDQADARPFIKGAEVSIVVHPDKRRQGFGIKALEYARQAARQAQVNILYAMVRPRNEPSKKLFLKSGYTLTEQRTVLVDTLSGREPVDVDIYTLDVEPVPLQQKVFLIAEIGSNWQIGTHEERRVLAARLVEAAAVAGFDAVKFQTFKAEKVYAKGAGKSRYLGGHGIDTDIHAVFHEIEMAYEELPYLSKLANDAGLSFMSTPFSPEDFDAVDPFVAYHKVASYEIAHLPLLEKVAASKKPVFVSTGASYPDEISFAVKELQSRGCKDITLLQCTASYPAPPESLNLRAMLSLASAFSLPVGLSDHSLDYVTAPLLAVAFGARAIEKHVTLRRSLPGPDSYFSIEPHEMKLFVEKVRLAEKMVGSGQKVVLPDEEELFMFAKRAVQAIRPIEAGEVLKDGDNIAILRPGNNCKGAHPSLYRQICGKQARHAISLGDGIQLEDVS
jgi:sialic acid synthase SpsE/RimJ/RimL family protein N-acetyltransferase